ncbi:26S proteasome non-ATPase regulatory subunit 8 AltName: Full=26S proteasome regulatory subunit RPN12; Flags: Fragment [Serendipita indica DSM 11827]|nr:26S proteasome non-ATPase regulatory subunit 8 AltName: Full=26S proteasome regulatory subunit RPN12; Flags: Fragment [Serendipita indica DSM 11827]
MAHSAVKQIHGKLQRAFASSSKDTTPLLAQAKLDLIQAGLLVPVGEHREQDLSYARDILEIGAFWSIRVRDVPAFDRYFSQLQTFYTDYQGVLPPSPRQYPLQGLNLIRLLTQNRISDFHTVLESLPPETLQENPFIRHPVNLERWLMEGSYSKVWNAREEAPAAEYRFFVDSLMGTIRNEIASCEEAAYNSLPMADAQTLLFFNNQQDLMQFTQQRGWQPDLIRKVFTFPTKADDKAAEIPSRKIIAQALTCAKELEQIV